MLPGRQTEKPNSLSCQVQLLAGVVGKMSKKADVLAASQTGGSRANQFWLYCLDSILEFHPIMCVQKIVTRCLDLQSPCDVSRLVPKGKDVSNKSFVSFKVGLKPSLKEQALLASSWLDGLVFRGFVDQSKNARRPPFRTVDINQAPV